MTVVIIGSVVNGFRVVGPFATLAEAEAWTKGFEPFEAMAVTLLDPATPWQQLVDPAVEP
jgi:hypothetical protein